jgi:transposase-like protein
MENILSDFELFRTHQYCDTPLCDFYGKVGLSNLRIKTRKNKQLYCSGCKKTFSLHKGTMFYRLRTPLDKIIKALSLLSHGMGVKAVCAEESVTADSLRSWVVLASQHTEAFSAHMQHQMHLTQIQVDEFWSFIRKKKKT